MQVPKFGWMPSGADSGMPGVLSFNKKLKDMVISVELAVLLPVSSGTVSSVDLVCFYVQLKGEEVFEQLAVPLSSSPLVQLSSRLQLLSACLLPSPWVPLPGLLFDLLFVLVGVIGSSDEFKGYVVCVFVQVRVTDDTVKCQQIYIFVFVHVVMNSGFEEASMDLGCAAMMPVPLVVSSFPGVDAALSGPCPSGLGFAQSPTMRLCLCFQSFRSFFVGATLVFGFKNNNGLLTVLMDDVGKMMELASSWAQFNDAEISVLVDIGFNKLERSHDKAAAAIAGKCVLEKSIRALFFPKDDEKTGEERKEKKGKEEDHERNEEEKKERRVSASALVPHETMEQGSQSSDAQLEGNRVIGDMVNILVQGLDGRHLSMRVAQGTWVSVLCTDLVSKVGIPQDAFYLTRRTRVLHFEEELLLEQDERLCMRERLRGGMDGDWTCQHCGRQGCWVTKVRCYRFGKSKYDPPNQQSMDGNPNVPGWIRNQARQQTEQEWAQATRGAGVGSGTGGQPLGQKPPPPPQHQNQLPQNQRQKTQAQSRALSPVQEEESYEVL